MRRGHLVREFPGTGPLRVEVVGGASDVSLRAHGEVKARVELSLRGTWLGKRCGGEGTSFLSRATLAFFDGVLWVGPEPEGIQLELRLFLPSMRKWPPAMSQLSVPSKNGS